MKIQALGTMTSGLATPGPSHGRAQCNSRASVSGSTNDLCFQRGVDRAVDFGSSDWQLTHVFRGGEYSTVTGTPTSADGQ